MSLSEEYALFLGILEPEAYLNVHPARDKLSVEFGGTVLPLLDYLDCGVDEHRMSADDMKVLNQNVDYL